MRGWEAAQPPPPDLTMVEAPVAPSDGPTEAPSAPVMERTPPIRWCATPPPKENNPNGHRQPVPAFAASLTTTASSMTMVGTNPCAGGTGEDRETREAQEHPDASMA